MSAREELLGRAIDWFAEHGVGDTSLRTLAAGLGTSHRMLHYHFGSREGLLGAVVEAVEQGERETLRDLMARGGDDVYDAAAAFWGLIQPIAPQDVAVVLARVATGTPRSRHVDIAGPDPHDLVDMARRTYAARGQPIRLVPSWHTGVFDVGMAGDVLLPAADAEIAPTSFDDWIATLRGAPRVPRSVHRGAAG